jgi:hypothetical protein
MNSGSSGSRSALTAGIVLGYAVSILSLAGMLILAFATCGTSHREAASPPADVIIGDATTNTVMGRTKFGDIEFLGGRSGTCSADARDAVGVSYSQGDGSYGGGKHLAVEVDLPPGVQGPGTYDLTTTPMNITATYNFTATEHQDYAVVAGRTGAKLVINGDGSGSLEITDLALLPMDDPTTAPLHLVVSFTCL